MKAGRNGSTIALQEKRREEDGEERVRRTRAGVLSYLRALMRALTPRTIKNILNMRLTYSFGTY